MRSEEGEQRDLLSPHHTNKQVEREPRNTGTNAAIVQTLTKC